jgi:hypothetical protein
MMNSTAPSTTRRTASISPMQTVFTDVGKVAEFIIQRGRIGFEAFTADERTVGMFVTTHRAATYLRELAAPAR